MSMAFYVQLRVLMVFFEALSSFISESEMVYCIPETR
ncbi:MAG: hypothetical protein K0R67_329 [Paenibacillus sp.]|nr:hypothetical protein [Paenibacillus sp.]